MRADAAKNREHVLAVAREALREAGDASLIGIARRAGVGPGTLYRHFPTREALIAAVYQDDVDRLVRLVPQVLAEHAPWTRSARGSVPSRSSSSSSGASGRRCKPRRCRR